MTREGRPSDGGAARAAFFSFFRLRGAGPRKKQRAYLSAARAAAHTRGAAPEMSDGDEQAAPPKRLRDALGLPDDGDSGGSEPAQKRGRGDDAAAQKRARAHYRRAVLERARDKVQGTAAAHLLATIDAKADWAAKAGVWMPGGVAPALEELARTRAVVAGGGKQRVLAAVTGALPHAASVALVGYDGASSPFSLPGIARAVALVDCPNLTHLTSERGTGVYATETVVIAGCPALEKVAIFPKFSDVTRVFVAADASPEACRAVLNAVRLRRSGAAGAPYVPLALLVMPHWDGLARGLVASGAIRAGAARISAATAEPCPAFGEWQTAAIARAVAAATVDLGVVAGPAHACLMRALGIVDGFAATFAAPEITSARATIGTLGATLAQMGRPSRHFAPAVTAAA